MTDTINSQQAQPQLVALFASDVHLRAGLPRTSQAFFHFLKHEANNAQQLYLLGDLFEYWVGDDAINDTYHQEVVRELRAVSDAGTRIYLIVGNRDFLLGEAFCAATGIQLLQDPTVLEIAGQRIVLMHGDAECTDDTAYMAFRKQVRDPAWQTQFLQMPLAQRKAIVEGLRQDSKMEQKEKSNDIMDVNADAIHKIFTATDAKIMIHGHTHRPAKHENTDGIRFVLPDWDCDIEKVRGGWLGLYDDGSFITHPVDV